MKRLRRLAVSAALLPVAAWAQGSSVGDGSIPTAYAVQGVVFDSLTQSPLAGAFVVATPAGATATTDSLGQFALRTREPVGELTVYHTVLDAIGVGALRLRRPTIAGDWLEAQLATPSLATLWRSLCGRPAPTEAPSGIVLGTARLDDNRTLVSGAKVVIEWLASATAPAGSGDGDSGNELVEAITDSLGSYVACGVAPGVEPALVAVSRQARSGVIQLAAALSPVQRVDLVLSPLGSGGREGELRGRVTDEAGDPVAGVRVSVGGREGEVLTAGDGSFRLENVPLGSRMVSFRGIGYRPATQAVSLSVTPLAPLAITLSRVIELDEVRVTASATTNTRLLDFNSRRRAGLARFVDSTEIMRAPVLRNAIQMIPFLQVTTIGGSLFGLRGPNGCDPHIYLDGTLSDIREVNEMPRENVAAIEVYRSVAFAPAQFIRVMADDCSVVLFWTKWALRR